MDEHQQNTIAIAELKGDLKAIRAENDAMETRIDASLDRLRTDIRADMEKRDKETIQRDKETIQRDKDNQRWIVGVGIAQMVIIIAIIAAGFAFLGILIGLPN